jgi:DNA adenine methylase
VTSGRSTHSGDAITTGKPFLRWAGSKRKQIKRLGAFWSPERHDRYIEPFAGSACLFFSLAPPWAILGDTNKELIEVYRVVRECPNQLYKRLCDIQRDQETYKHWRDRDPHSLDRETRALRFLYLNRNCFNGIYRTNLDGQFNVPMGRKVGAYFSEADLTRCAELLQVAQLVAGDFSETLSRVTTGDFVYLDPPYAVNSRRIFREYGSHLFDTRDVSRLSECLIEVDRKGADFLVSYADCREARVLARKWNAARLPIRRHIAGFAGARKNAYEWLITNMPMVE